MACADSWRRPGKLPAFGELPFWARSRQPKPIQRTSTYSSSWLTMPTSQGWPSVRDVCRGTQGFNRGADVFLADEQGTYIGRTCHWKHCRPGVRQACDALHCGRRPYLHDDLEAIHLNANVVRTPPVTIWPVVERRIELPPDVEKVVAALEHAV